MPRFFTTLIGEDTVCIEGPDAAHISLSLRMKPGEPLTACDGRGTDYRCVIREIRRERVVLTIREKLPSPGETAVRVTLYQALCKGDKMETIVQKAVELGAAEVVPVLTARCVARPDAQGMEKKLARYARVALEAAKQCGRGIVPEVRPTVPLQELPERLRHYDLSLLFYERAAQRLSSIDLGGKHTLAVIVGAEGGFEEEEAALLKAAGARPLSLGSRILRCETAPLAALAAILYATGEM